MSKKLKKTERTLAILIYIQFATDRNAFKMGISISL